MSTFDTPRPAKPTGKRRVHAVSSPQLNMVIALNENMQRLSQVYLAFIFNFSRSRSKYEPLYSKERLNCISTGSDDPTSLTTHVRR